MASVEIDNLGAQEKYYFHADYLGSVRMISDDNALVVWQKRYTPFGDTEEESGTIENTYSFTGKGFDAEGDLYYFNARWYDSDVGRFISEDPLWGNIFDPQSLNRFRYARNNPFRFTDSTGLYDDHDNYGDTELFGGPSDDGQDDGYDDGEGDSDSTESCTIQVRFNRVNPTRYLHGYLLTFPGYKPDANAMYFRGGPGYQSGLFYLDTEYGSYNPDTIDYNGQSGTQPRMDPIKIHESCKQVNDKLANIMDDIESRKLIYAGFSQNSNSVWAEGFRNFGGNPSGEISFDYSWGAPGKNVILPQR